MSFASLEFVAFFSIVCTLYFAIAYRWRWLFLLVASYVFYAYWNTWYIILIVFSTMVDYIVAREIHKTDLQRKRKMLLFISMAVNLGVLFIFKYFNFFNESAVQMLETIGINYNAKTLDVLLPVGISFYTFQSMSYTIDVYRKDIEPENNPGIFATYVAFFPQLVAGPIERAGNIIPQFHQQFDFDYDRIVNGLRRILWGVFKKIVIADHLAFYVNAVYNNVHDYSGFILIIATGFFAFQIYCDFSAYSDIAIGTAQVLGIKLMENFRQPYLSHSPRDFWRRWHISLSTWFRDYLYIPLGGGRVKFGWVLINLMIVFVVSGLWHGANWTFAIWGALHGLYVVIEVMLARFKLSLPVPQIFKIALTFGLVSFAWIFFRANSLDDAWYIVNNILDFSADDSFEIFSRPFNANGQQLALIGFGLSWFLLIILMLIDWYDVHQNIIQRISRSNWLFRWVVYNILGVSIVFSLIARYGDTVEPFIYFQF